MPTVPDDRFELPENFGPGSVWADRSGERAGAVHPTDRREAPE